LSYRCFPWVTVYPDFSIFDRTEAIQFEPVMTRTEMRQAVFEYIDVDYNRKRRHSSIGYTSPFNFELKNIA
jgi:transposase InsO family protein